MKLLFVAPYIYAPAYKEHSKNKTGFGFMVYDIASGAGKCGNQVVLATHAFGPKRSCDGFKVAGNSLWKNILYGHYRGLVRFCVSLKKTGASLKDVVKGAYYYLHIGYIKHLVKKEKPDVVHIHGCSVETEETINMLRRIGVPHVVTLHGLLQDDLDAADYQKKCEQKMIAGSRENNTPITVISSKMKLCLSSAYYGLQNTEHVTVVTNGINVSGNDATESVWDKYGIPKEKKLILSVGSGCERKNQLQVVRTFSLLPAAQRENCVLLFVGTIYPNYPLGEEIEALGLGEQVLCTGFIPREELPGLYAVAHMTVTASISEGFGLPMIEGFVYGTPCVTFFDLDAIGDIYDECAMLLCRERSDEALAETIGSALSKQWDKDQIKAHSKKFSLEAMAEKYNAVYKRLIEKSER